jgi:Flp pilus assembly protein TadG
MKRDCQRTLRKDQRGAVLAEFIVAIVPLLMMFFGFAQLAKLAAGRIVLKHSAIVAARAASVMTNAANNNPCQPNGMNEGQILNAATMALGRYWGRNGGFERMAVTVTDTSSRSDPYNWVSVRVVGVFECDVPMMGRIMCGGATTTMRAEVFRMPHQGASYTCEN